jgi:hypothetical protein
MEASEWDERDGRLRHKGMWSSAAGVAEIQLVARKGLPSLRKAAVIASGYSFAMPGIVNPIALS